MITSYFATQETVNMMTSCQGEGHMSYISRRDCAKAAMYALVREDLHYATLNINGPESLTLQEFVDAGNQATKLNIGINNVTEEDSGINKVILYYKTESESTYSSQTYTYNYEGSMTPRTFNLTAIFPNSTETYYMYAEIYDVAGNIARSCTASVAVGGYTNYADDATTY